MATNDQITRIKHLTKILNKYRDEYYNESRPSVDDSTYDSMMDELRILKIKQNFTVQTVQITQLDMLSIQSCLNLSIVIRC